MDRAGFWRRVAAAIIDACIVYFSASALYVFIFTYVIPNVWSVDNEDRYSMLVIMPLWLAYFALEVIFGRTVGKLALGIEIRAVDGTAPDRWTLFLRYITKHLTAVFFLLFGLTASPLFHLLGGFMNLIIMIGCLRALGESKLTWHDLWSHTAVYRKPRPEMQGFPVATPHPNPATQGVPPPS